MWKKYFERNILKPCHVLKDHRGLQIKEMLFKCHISTGRGGFRAVINLNISGSGSFFMRYGEMISNWRKYKAEPAGISEIYTLAACHGGRQDSAWDLLWGWREGCSLPPHVDILGDSRDVCLGQVGWAWLVPSAGSSASAQQLLHAPGEAKPNSSVFLEMVLQPPCRTSWVLVFCPMLKVIFWCVIILKKF